VQSQELTLSPLSLTGHGLKDPDVAIAQSAKPLTVDAELRAIEKVIREHLPTI